MEFINKNIDPKKLFVSNNTIGVANRLESFKSKIKDTVLFVGSLNERKGLVETLEIFKNIIDFIPKEVVFIIIGDGELKYKIENFKDLNKELIEYIYSLKEDDKKGVKNQIGVDGTLKILK